MASKKSWLIGGISALILGGAGVSYLASQSNIQHTSHWKEIAAGGTWFQGNYQPGDTLHFSSANYTYFSGASTNGTPDNPIVCLFDAGAEFSAGFNLTDCSNWKFDGGLNKNLYIHNASGVAFSFKGKCNNIQLYGVKINGCYSYVWWKTEVADFTDSGHWTFNADGTISPSFIMDGFKLDNFDFSNANFDGCYLLSTGQNADRAVVINGKTYYPLPAKGKNVQISNGIIDGAARTGMQVSGLLPGLNYLKNVTIKNCGKSLEQYQGANFLIGGNSTGDFTIDSCTFDGSNLYAVRTDGAGIIRFTNNTVKNATVVNGKMSAVKVAAVQLDGAAPQSTFIVTGNTIDSSNNNVSLVVYGNANNVSGNSIVANNKLLGAFQNQTGVKFQTTGSVPVPPIDTTKPPVITPPIDTTKPSPPIDTTTINNVYTFIKGDNFSIIFKRIGKPDTTVLNVKTIIFNNTSNTFRYILRGKDNARKPVN